MARHQILWNRIITNTTITPKKRLYLFSHYKDRLIANKFYLFLYSDNLSIENRLSFILPLLDMNKFRILD